MTTRSVAPGSTDQSLVFYAYDADGAGVNLTHESTELSLSYRVDSDGRQGTPVAMTPIARSSAGTHTEGAIANVSSGKHEVDVPDGVFDSDNTGKVVTLGVAATGVDVVYAERVTVESIAAAVLAAAEVTPIAAELRAGSSSLLINVTAETTAGLGVPGARAEIVGSVISRTTDALGAAALPVQHVTPTTYTVRLVSPVGYSSPDDQTVEVDTDDVSLTFITDSAALSEPDDPSLCNVAVDVITQHGTRPYATVWAVPADALPMAVNSIVVSDDETFTTTEGRAVVPLIRGTRVKICVEFNGVKKTIAYTVPVAATAVATVTV